MNLDPEGEIDLSVFALDAVQWLEEHDKTFFEQVSRAIIKNAIENSQRTGIAYNSFDLLREIIEKTDRKRAEQRQNTHPMLKCGHRANATNGKGFPVCAICAPHPDAETITEEPDLRLRKCRCPSCGTIVQSNEAVAFFEHRPNEEYDTHYDGCRGWD